MLETPCSERAHLPPDPSRRPRLQNRTIARSRKGHLPEGAFPLTLFATFGAVWGNRVTSLCSSQVTSERAGRSGFFSE